MLSTKNPTLSPGRPTTIVSSLADLVAVAASARLLRSRYPELYRVRCEFLEGVLTLRGRVSNYYMKQLAQNLAGKTEGVAEIDNRLDVIPF